MARDLPQPAKFFDSATASHHCPQSLPAALCISIPCNSFSEDNNEHNDARLVEVRQFTSAGDDDDELNVTERDYVYFYFLFPNTDPHKLPSPIMLRSGRSCTRECASWRTHSQRTNARCILSACSSSCLMAGSILIQHLF